MLLDVLRGRREDKKGQVTVFIILGILILAIVLGFVFLGGEKIIKGVGEEKDVPTEVAGVKLFVENCLENSVQTAIIEAGGRGGLYLMPFEYSIPFFDDALLYYYIDGKEIIPSIEESENSLAVGIKEKIMECVADFEVFKGKGYEITEEEIKVEVGYGKGIFIDLKYPLTIEKGGKKTNLDKFSYNVDLNFKKFFEVAGEIVDKYKTKPGYTCLTCFDKLADEEGVAIIAYPVYDTSPFGNDIIWYSIKNKEGKEIGNEEFVFDFIVEVP